MTVSSSPRITLGSETPYDADSGSLSLLLMLFSPRIVLAPFLGYGLEEEDVGGSSPLLGVLPCRTSLLSVVTEEPSRFQIQMETAASSPRSPFPESDLRPSVWLLRDTCLSEEPLHRRSRLDKWASNRLG